MYSCHRTLKRFLYSVHYLRFLSLCFFSNQRPKEETISSLLSSNNNNTTQFIVRIIIIIIIIYLFIIILFDFVIVCHSPAFVSFIFECPPRFISQIPDGNNENNATTTNIRRKMIFSFLCSSSLRYSCCFCRVFHIILKQSWPMVIIASLIRRLSQDDGINFE